MRYQYLLLLLLLLLPTVARGQSEPQLHWERYDNVVRIRADGSLRVEERQVLVVEAGRVRRMTREFETGSNGRVTEFSVSEDGVPYGRGGDQPGTFAASDDGTTATIQLWFRDPDARQHSFTIAYTVNDGLAVQGERAAFSWNFFWGSNNAPPIRNGSVELHFPSPVDATALQLSTGGVPVQQTTIGDGLRWELREPIQGEQLGVRAEFPRDVLASDARLGGGTAPRPTIPDTNVAPAAVGTGVLLVMCLFVIVMLFVVFLIVRSSARARHRSGYPPAYGPDPFGGPVPRTRRHRRRRGGYGGWGGGFFPPILLPPSGGRRQRSNPSRGDESGGSWSGWGDSGGSSSSWGDSGGSSSSWGDTGRGGGWGGGDKGGGGKGGGKGGGSFD